MNNKFALLLSLSFFAAMPAYAEISNLQFGGEVKTQVISTDDMDLAGSGVDSQSLQSKVRLSGDLSDHLSFFTEGRGVINFGDGNGEDPVTGEQLGNEDFLELREAWLQLDNPYSYTPLSFRLGRQRFSEPYGFWWNRNFDAARVIYDTTSFKGFLALGQNLTDYRTSGDDFNHDDEDILRVLAQGSWQWKYQHFIETRFVYQDDHSELESPGSLVQLTNRDDSDAQLFWAGLRFGGQLPGKTVGIANNNYRIDLAGLIGTEDTVLMTGGPTGFRTVTGNRNSDVSAFALDAATDIALPLVLNPVLTLGYAFGSGDSNAADGSNHNFRQTGLDSNFSHPGVSTIGVHHYGSVLRPDLSNLHILTAGIGAPFFKATDLNFVYHYYRLAHEGGDVDVRSVTAPLSGASADLGQGLDMIFTVNMAKEFDWHLPAAKSVDFRTTLGAFRAGDAFGGDEGNVALRGLFELRYSF